MAFLHLGYKQQSVVKKRFYETYTKYTAKNSTPRIL